MVRHFNYIVAAVIATLVTGWAYWGIGGIATVFFISSASFIITGAALIFIQTEFEQGWRFSIMSQLLERIQVSVIKAGCISVLVPGILIGIIHRDTQLSSAVSCFLYAVFSQVLWWCYYKDVRETIDEYMILTGVTRCRGK
jgi:hypothetical protein